MITLTKENQCKDLTDKIKRIRSSKSKSFNEWSSKAMAVGMLASLRAWAKHDYQYVPVTPFIYEHKCIHCGKKKEWYNDN